MTSTQQSEALQAVRLLYVAAHGGGGSDHKNPETLFRARVLLEEFIKSAGVLESTEPVTDVFHSDAIWRGMKYRIEGMVFVEIYGKRLKGRIEAFKPTGFTSVTVEGLGLTEFDWTDIVQWNPDGSK